MSILRQGIRSLILLEALLATEEELLSPVSDGEGLAPGNIATTNGILDQVFFGVFRTDSFPLGGEKGAF